MLKHCQYEGRLLIPLLVCWMCSLEVTSQSSDRDAVDEGRQIIRDLYTNLSSISSSTSSAMTNSVDLIFVLDRSASVTDSGWQSMLRFVQNFLEHFTIDSDNTRVAVISYSTTASVDIDGIGSGDYNKCAFVSRLQRQMSKKVPSGYSSTYDAILRAKDVVLGARAYAKKAVIVITDGKSNIGPPPVRASIQLRSLVWDVGWNTTSQGPQLQVYAFGIKDAYMPEVRSIASPLPNRTFYIPTFQAFAELARSLHDDSQTENWHVLGDSGPCNGVCHEKAYCACGTRSGQYMCICRDGYQGDGLTCTACHRGTYKSTISPSRCLPCPSNATTLASGASNVKQCVCQPPLYQDAAGLPCHIRYCEDLPDIEHGHKFHVPGQVVDELPDTGIKCKNLPDSSCHFQCDVGYRLDGHPGLVCHANGSWSGDVPSCHIVDCGTLDYHQQEPQHATVQYINQTTTYGSVVRVECHQGWRTFGDFERVCTHFGAWSGTQTWCVENHCPALPLTPGLIIMPASCGQAAQVPGAICQYVCVLGYEMTGPVQVVCTEHGMWDSSSPTVCIDREPPSITCPDDITTPVTTANFAVIHWKSYPPLVTDNSGEFIITGIGVADSDNPLRLTSGYHQIKYIARDKTGNEAYCVQGITVVDFTVHLVTCPERDVTINMTSHQQEAVWPEVSFADHNNVTVTHKCVPANNTLLPAGVYTVMCVPDTRSYQQTHCQFKAILRQPKCDIPPPPLHGSVSCTPTPTSLLTCIPYCHDNFDFHYLPQGAYVCDLDGNWKLRTTGHFWPDCSRKYQAHKATLRGQAKYFYYAGRCEDVKAQIAEKFTEFLEKQAWEICGSDSCNVKTVDVYCGHESKRKRRSARGVAQRYQALQATPFISMIHFPLQSSIGSSNLSTEASLDNFSENADDHNFDKSAGLLQDGGRTARSVSHKLSLDIMKNLEKAEKSGQHRNNASGKMNLEADELGEHDASMDKESGNLENDADRAIIRELYLIGKIKPKHFLNTNLTSKGKLLNQDGDYSRSSTKVPETVGFSEENVTGDAPKEMKASEVHPDKFNASVTPPQAQASDRMLQPLQHDREIILPSEQDVTESDSSEIVLPKRSVREMMAHDLGNPETSRDYDNGNLTNVTSLDYENQILYEVKVKFTINKEIVNKEVDDVEQSELINKLMDVYIKLNESLDSHDLILDDSNTTSLTDASNGSLSGGINILFALQHELEFPTLDTCDFGYVTRVGFAVSTQTCVACPAGSHYDMTRDQCLTCPLGYYQPEEAQSECLSCPDEMMTQFPGAHNISMCLAMCDPGQFSGTGLAPCQLCPLHSYQPFSSAAACLPCPMGRKTLTTGAVHDIDCLDLCTPGTYSDTGLVPCRSCPVGAYQPDDGATECLLCEDGMTTETERASNVSECFAWDACFSQGLVCENGGQCVVQNNVATCVCASGFSGASCEINIPDCFASSCQNNGTCIDGINTYTCACIPGFTGPGCEVNIDECLSSPCHNGGSCLDLLIGYKCFCSHDYTGVRCETKLVLCDGSICVHGKCEEWNGVTSCVCNHGFAGSICNTSYDLCSSHPCIHADECVSTPGQFVCHCLPGYTGVQCDSVLDPCDNSNCSRVSTCIPSQGAQLGYLCKCPGGWSGEFCDNEITADFDLVFNTNGPDGQYVVLPPEFMPSLQNFSICAWLRPQPLSAFATIVAFTLPVSPLTSQDSDYFVDRGHDEFDTVFSIKHTDKLIIGIFGHSIYTNVTLTFYVWSHLCVTWSCPTSHWQVVVNGSVSAEGTEGRVWPSLPPRAHLVLGQSNPYYAEASMLWDVYAGEITQFNVFGHVLSLDDLRMASGMTCNKTFGDVISWTDVLPNTKGDLIIRENSHCLDVNECWFPAQFPCGSKKECIDLLGSYDCSSCVYGYTGSDCEDSDDECAMDACVRGECIDGPEPYDFHCICPSGFTGLSCEVMIDLCVSNPCQNGGNCTPAANSYSCACPLQHMGPLCERPASACLPNPCQNQGVCVEKTEDTFECSCPDSFSGRICERRKHWCEDHACHNGGVCQNHSVSLQNNVIFRSQDESFCKCQHGWLGRQCEVRMVLSCDLSPCVNGGTCLPLPDSEQGYHCQCLVTQNVFVDENCEYLNPCDLSPCANNTLCVMLPNYTFTCLCVGGHPCDSTHAHLPSNISNDDDIFSHPTGNTITSALDGKLTSIWIWTLTGAAVFLVLLAVAFTSCFLWRRKSKRVQGVTFSNTVDVARGHLTNPAFHSEELQLEESIYAELGDGYTLPQDDSIADIESRQGSVKPASSQRAVSRNTSASSSGSLSSLRSSLSKKFSVADDTNKPLLSDDYLEPHVLGVTNYVEFVNQGSARLTQRSGVTNAGFDSSEYVISEMDKSTDIVGAVSFGSNRMSGAEIAGEDDKIGYVNERGLKSEVVQHKHSQEDGSADVTSVGAVFSCDVNKLSKYEANQAHIAGTGYINVRPDVHGCKWSQPSDRLADNGFCQEKGLKVVYNPGYIPSGNLPADISSQFDGGDSHVDRQPFLTSVTTDMNTRTIQDSQLPQECLDDVKTSATPLRESYIPFADVWNTAHDFHSMSFPGDTTRFRNKKNVTHTAQAGADSQNELSQIQPLSVSVLDSRETELLKPPVNLPALPSSASGNFSYPSDYHKPSPVFDPTLKEELRSDSLQPSEGGSNDSKCSPILPSEETEMPREIRRSSLVDQPCPSDKKIDGKGDSCIEFIPEYVELLPSDKLVLSLPEFSTSKHRQNPASASVESLEAATMKPALSGVFPGKKPPTSSLSPSHFTNRTLPHSGHTTVSSHNTSSIPSEALPPKSPSLPPLSSGQTKSKSHTYSAPHTAGKQKVGEVIVLENFSPKASTSDLLSQKTPKKKDKLILENFSDHKSVNRRRLTGEHTLVQAHPGNISKAATQENANLFPSEQQLLENSIGTPKELSIGHTSLSSKQQSTGHTSLSPKQQSTGHTSLSPKQQSTGHTNLPSKQLSTGHTNLPSKQQSTGHTNLPSKQQSTGHTSVSPKQQSTGYTNLPSKQQSVSGAGLGDRRTINPSSDLKSEELGVSELTEQHDASTSDHTIQGRKLPPVPDL